MTIIYDNNGALFLDNGEAFAFVEHQSALVRMGLTSLDGIRYAYFSIEEGKFITQPDVGPSVRDSEVPLITEMNSLRTSKYLDFHLQNWPLADPEFLIAFKEYKLLEVITASNLAYNSALGAYSDSERATFISQESEARSYSLDNTAATPTIDTLAVTRGISKLDLINKILANLTERDIATGQQQALEDQIKACTTLEELEAITI